MDFLQSLIVRLPFSGVETNLLVPPAVAFAVLLMYFGARCQKHMPAPLIKAILFLCVLFVAAKYTVGFFSSWTIDDFYRRRVTRNRFIGLGLDRTARRQRSESPACSLTFG